MVATADRDENQFPTYEVLRCDEVFRWIKNGKYYEFPGVSRSQNSYNKNCCLIGKLISENRAKSVKLSSRQRRDNFIDCERL